MTDVRTSDPVKPKPVVRRPGEIKGLLIEAAQTRVGNECRGRHPRGEQRLDPGARHQPVLAQPR